MPMHKDDSSASVTLPDGRVIRNLTDEEYEATYAEGTPHAIPSDELAKAVMAARARTQHRGYDGEGDQP